MTSNSCPRLRAGLSVTALAVALTAGLAGSAVPASASPSTVRATNGEATVPAGPAYARVQPGVRAAVTSVGSELARGQSLTSGQSIVSPNGRYSLVVGTDGLLSYREAPNRLNPNPVVRELVPGPPGSHLDLQTDGNLVYYGPDASVLLNFGTAGSTAARLVIQDDRNLVLYGATNEVIINFGFAQEPFLVAGQALLPGDALTDPASGTRLVMQSDGNLVVYTAAGAAVFSTNTQGNPGAAVILQNDGNLVVYSNANPPVALFSTGTSVTDGSKYLLGVFGSEIKVLDGDGVSRYGSAWTTDSVTAGQLLLPGDRRQSTTRACFLLQQTDGNLVDYCGGAVVFATLTGGDVFSFMNPNGNFLTSQLVSGRLKKVFQTNTAGNAGARLTVQDDRNLVVYTVKNRPVFHTR